MENFSTFCFVLYHITIKPTMSYVIVNWKFNDNFFYPLTCQTRLLGVFDDASNNKTLT